MKVIDHIVVDKNVRPVIHAPRRVPLSLQPKLKTALEDHLAQTRTHVANVEEVFELDEDDLDDGQAPRRQRRRLSFLQVAAWVIVAPFYLAIAAGSVAILALFVTRLLAA